MDDHSTLCRLCLDLDADNGNKISLFDSPILREKIETLLKINIEVINCTETPMVCQKCANKLTAFSNFQDLALKNDQKCEDQKLMTTNQVLFIKDELIDTRDFLCESEGILRDSASIPKKKGRQKGTSLNHLEHPYLCGECELKYATLNSLQKHCEVDHPSTRVQCSSCMTHVFGQATLGYHQNICQFHLGTAKQEFLCTLCPRKFFSRSILTKHLKLCGKTDAFACRHCGRTFDRTVHVDQHEKSCDKAPSIGEVSDTNDISTIKEELEEQVKHKKRRKKDKSEYYIMGNFLCTDCEFSTQNFNSLRKHCSTKHPESKQLCPGCNIAMYGESTMKAHMDLCKFIQTDVTTFWQCEKHCTQKFDKMAGFAAHMKTCTRMTEKPRCPKCNKQLARGGSYGLKSHMEKCDGSPANYSCCDTDFASFKPFLIHKKHVHHFEIDEKSEICPICEKVLKTAALMMMHLRNRHFSNRCKDTFPCTVEGCGKILMQKKSLVQHLENHEKNHNREVFSCDVCRKTFFSNSGLNCHKCLENTSTIEVTPGFYGNDLGAHFMEATSSDASSSVREDSKEKLLQLTSHSSSQSSFLVSDDSKENTLEISSFDQSSSQSSFPVCEDSKEDILENNSDGSLPASNKNVLEETTFAWAEVADDGDGDALYC